MMIVLQAPAVNTGQPSSEQPSCAQLAEQGFKGMMSGDGNVLGGTLKSRGMGLSGNVTPDAAGAEMNRKLNEPRSAEK